MEIWKEINIQEDQCKNYEVSNFGNVRNKITKKKRKKTITPKGYESINLLFKQKKKIYTIHQLVLITFGQEHPGEGYTCDHIDNNRLNNHIDNLRWLTISEQNLNSNQIKKNEKQKTTNKIILKCDENWNVIEEFSSLREAAKNLNLVKGNSIITNIQKKKKYKNFYWKYKTVENKENEIWKPFNEIYVSNMGRLKDNTEREIRGHQDTYHCFKLKGKFYTTHIIVCELFNGEKPFEDAVVNHINGNKKDNRSTNLEWCTQSENILHAHKMFDYAKNFRKEVFKIDTTDGSIVEKYPSVREAARKHNVAFCTISNRIKNETLIDKRYKFKFAF